MRLNSVSSSSKTACSQPPELGPIEYLSFGIVIVALVVVGWMAYGS